MIFFNAYQQLLSRLVRQKSNALVQGFNLQPGDLVGFMFRPKKGDGAKVNDMFVLLVAMEMRSEGGGKGIWGFNVFDMPGDPNRKKMMDMFNDPAFDRLTFMSELHRNSVTRKAFKYYHMDGIITNIVKFDEKKIKDLV